MFHRGLLAVVIAILISGSLVGAQYFFTRHIERSTITEPMPPRDKPMTFFDRIREQFSSQEIRVPRPDGEFSPQERRSGPDGARRALHIIQKHKEHIHGVHIRITSIASGARAHGADVTSVEGFVAKLAAQYEFLNELENAIITKSWTKHEVGKAMESLRPRMKDIMRDLKFELEKLRSQFIRG